MTITRFITGINPTHVKKKQIEVGRAKEHRLLSQQGPASSFSFGYKLEAGIPSGQVREALQRPRTLGACGRSHHLQTQCYHKIIKGYPFERHGEEAQKEENGTYGCSEEQNWVKYLIP